MSYGSTNEVAALVPRYANADNVFTATTRPSLAQVETWLTQVSAVLDAYLATKGYSTPITATDLNAAMDLFVAEEVASIAEGVNGSGRFGPTAANQKQQGRWAIVRADVTDYIDSLLVGNVATAGSAAVTREDGFTTT